MRGRLLLAKWGIVLGSGVASAQLPRVPEAPPNLPTYPGPNFPGSPLPPNPLPPLQPIMPVNPGGNTPSFPQPSYPGTNLPGAPNPFPPAFPPPGTYIPGSPQNPGLPPSGSPVPGYPGVNAPGFPNPYASGSLNPNPVAQPQEFALPQPETKFAINANDVTLKRIAGAWQLWAGQKMLRDFGERETDARDAFRVYRDLRPTEWVTIGGSKPVVEYALVNGRPPMTLGVPGADDPRNPTGSMGGAGNTGNAGGFSQGGFGGGMNGPAATGAGAKLIIPIDLRTVRVEAVRGVWCLRDDSNIHFNFGPVKADAEQALAVVRRYGFNRIGIVGAPMPVMSYFFVGADTAPPPKGPFVQAALQAQIDALTRVGIPVPGVGYVGEMIRFDPRKLEVRKVGGDWLVMAGNDVIGSYGPGESTARDAARMIADLRFNEFCKVGSAGLTFFLIDGKAPDNVPFSVQGRRFDPNAIKVQRTTNGWVITENNRQLLTCASAEEGETLIRVLKSFQFDQLCQLGPTPKLGVSFLAKGR